MVARSIKAAESKPKTPCWKSLSGNAISVLTSLFFMAFASEIVFVTYVIVPGYIPFYELTQAQIPAFRIHTRPLRGSRSLRASNWRTYGRAMLRQHPYPPRVHSLRVRGGIIDVLQTLHVVLASRNRMSTGAQCFGEDRLRGQQC